MEIEEDTYSSIFQALKHPIRRRILRMLNEHPQTYTEILNELGIDNGLLNYHLENLRELLAKGEDEKYRLSEFGKAGLSVIERVETPKDSFVRPSYLRIDGLPSILIILLLFSSAHEPDLLSLGLGKGGSLSLSFRNEWSSQIVDHLELYLEDT